MQKEECTQWLNSSHSMEAALSFSMSPEASPHLTARYVGMAEAFALGKRNSALSLKYLWEHSVKSYAALRCL